MGAQEFRRYAESQRKASLLAQREFSEWWDGIDKSDPYAVRDALLAVVPGIVYKYGGMAGLAAAEYYEAERAAAGGGESFRAEIAEPAPLEQLEASVRYACGHLFGGGDGA